MGEDNNGGEDSGSKPVPQAMNGQANLNGAAVKVRKSRGGAGVNHSLGRYVKIGDEIDVDLETAALCIIGKEFDLVDEGDTERVAAAIAEIHRRDAAPNE